MAETDVRKLVERFVLRSTAASGVPAKVSDRAVLKDLARLLRR